VRRIAAIVAVIAALGSGAVLVLQPAAQAGGSTRVDVVFDDAHGLIKGQLLEIAGARAGKITDVKVTPDFKARIQMTVQSQYAPFKQDATCTIRPQGLIAENYVDCDPGKPDSPALKSQDGEAPTVPVDHTTAPVPVTDLFDIWNAPTTARLSLLINELGIGAAGRGQDFNDVLRRTNPSLALARKVINVLDRQRNDLASILDNADSVVGKLADRGQTFQQFVDAADQTTSITASHNTQLADAVHRLPALIDAANPALRDLNTVVDSGTPLVRSLRQSAPQLNRLSADLRPFAQQIQPTLTTLTPVLKRGITTLKAAVPLSRLLRSYVHSSLPAAQLAGPLFTNLRDRGFVENLLSTFYGVAAGTSRFNSLGHFIPAYATLGTCALSSTTSYDPNCSARYTPGATNAARGEKKSSAKKPAQPAAKTPAASAPAAAAPQAPATPSATPPTTPLLKDPVQAVKDLLDSVLKPGKQQPPSDNPVSNLLKFLLG
jgi:virulence factor Mce-like protein